jgi:hypothetical protein
VELSPPQSAQESLTIPDHGTPSHPAHVELSPSQEPHTSSASPE